jgi:cytochrome c-type biogenesis protein CcmH
MIRALFAALALGWASLALPALAVEPDEILDDPALEARAREISAGLRCLVCQNESIDASSADLAKDLRILVRERLVAGDSDDEVRAFMVARYGDFVLLKPPVKPETYVLWFGPAAILLAGAFGVAVYIRRRRPQRAQAEAGDALSSAERARLERLLSGTDDGNAGA